MDDEVRIVIADDHPVLRHGLVRVIESDPLLKVVAETGDGAEALAQIRALEPRPSSMRTCRSSMASAYCGRSRRGDFPSKLSFSPFMTRKTYSTPPLSSAQRATSSRTALSRKLLPGYGQFRLENTIGALPWHRMWCSTASALRPSLRGTLV